MIVGLVFVSVFVIGFYSYFVMTKIYESKASILSPRDSGGVGGGVGAAAALAAPGVGRLLGGLIQAGGSNRDVFVAILKSRTMARDLKDWVISVKVEDKDPKLAADIANAYVTNLDRMFAKLGTTDASRQRAFIEGRLEKTEKPLRQSEETLRRFTEDNKAVVIGERASRGGDCLAGSRSGPGSPALSDLWLISLTKA